MAELLLILATLAVIRPYRVAWTLFGVLLHWAAILMYVLTMHATLIGP